MATTYSATFSRPPAGPQTKRDVKDREDEGRGIWSSLLESVSSGKKKLAEKTILILGGNDEPQTDFLEAIAHAPATQRRNPRDRSQRKKPPVANGYALGFTYQDVVDTDQDDILARLSIYMLGDTCPAFASLLKPLFSTNTIPDMLVVILLDWQEPWNWMRQLSDRIRILRSVLDGMDESCMDAMEETMKDWRERRRGSVADEIATKASDANVVIPLGPGEWDEAIGVPLCVVCHNAEKIHILETEHGWKDKEFDAVMQYLRTVLLKHGASLIYTASSDPGSLQSLVRSSLDIRSLTQRDNLRRNVTDRDKVLIPPNWDTWGKIRALGEEFPVEEVSKSWSADIKALLQPTAAVGGPVDVRNETLDEHSERNSNQESSRTVMNYERTIHNPHKRESRPSSTDPNKVKGPTLLCPDYQEFLTKQATRLEKYRQRDEAEKQAKAAKRPPMVYATTGENGTISDHLGPVQFNMGGISVDAEAAIQALQTRAPRRESEDESPVVSPEGRSEDEKRLAFFAALKVEGRSGGSASNTGHSR